MAQMMSQGTVSLLDISNSDNEETCKATDEKAPRAMSCTAAW